MFVSLQQLKAAAVLDNAGILHGSGNRRLRRVARLAQRLTIYCFAKSHKLQRVFHRNGIHFAEQRIDQLDARKLEICKRGVREGYLIERMLGNAPCSRVKGQ